MTHEELQDGYELYALGVAGEPERSEIRQHLARGCEMCRRQLQRARELNAMLAMAPEPAAPSPGLRRRILAATGAEPRRFGIAPFLAGALLLTLFAAVYFSNRERVFANETLMLREQLRNGTIELTELHEALAILRAPGTVEAKFGPAPQGKVFVNAQRGVLLVAGGLPQAPVGKVYEMWIVPKNGKPVAAGLFQSDAGGAATRVQPGPAAPGAVTVTMEPAPGSAAPTSAPLLTATLP
jgi:hypothetical protein